VWGEDHAARHARRRGAVLLDRRVVVPGGELDLVLDDGGVLAFGEVKTRARAQDALDAVTPTKRGRIVHAARCYMQHQGLDPQRVGWRFDVFLVEPRPGGPSVTWLKGAFEA
jgi:putative endonuclease